MLAYKFRSATQIEYVLDILFNNRLFCADWSRLNDPMEGFFGYSYSSTDEVDYSKRLDEITDHKRHIKVCSLSGTFDSHLLWAHYADGFSSVAIEIELPDKCPKVRNVTYGGVFTTISIADERLPKETARRILSSKYAAWSYEKEVRILNDSEWYGLVKPVRRIIVGHRMTPSLFEGLRIICDRREITINRTGIGDEGIDADYVPPLEAVPAPIPRPE
jgi:hypothetical protein